MLQDNWRLIVQKKLDGGDTLAREADFHFCWAILDKTPLYDVPWLSDLECDWGIWRRHPDITKWYSNPKTTSRDQIVTLIVYLGVIRDYARLFRLFVRTTLRLGFAQNYRSDDGTTFKIPDSMHFYYGLFLRAFGRYAIWAYPLLLLFDLYLLGSTIFDCRPWRNPDDVDETNMIAQHRQAQIWAPTPLSWLARRIYVRFRPTNNGNTVNGEDNAIIGAVSWYFDNPDFRDNKDFIELYRPQVNALLKK